MYTRRKPQPPAGWELKVTVPELDPEFYDAGTVDVYESRHLTKDGTTFVYGSWTAVSGLEIVVEQDGAEISLPSGWAARQLAELLFTLAGQS